MIELTEYLNLHSLIKSKIEQLLVKYIGEINGNRIIKFFRLIFKPFMKHMKIQ